VNDIAERIARHFGRKGRDDWRSLREAGFASEAYEIDEQSKPDWKRAGRI